MNELTADTIVEKMAAYMPDKPDEEFVDANGNCATTSCGPPPRGTSGQAASTGARWARSGTRCCVCART
ncbi:hypothetical protein [Nonomuraea diastatica]|uniref:Uncharacterized protein n=1 Tax=Nonomuraea diastatica TaxID=1848329 RepID=A0A4R4VYW4_9ACTN|nr:hypothetical protein [Nonomuraea diastatica]TDD11318.1 hypothetical protein E1294_45310 [Nonomuraea diastatica]